MTAVSPGNSRAVEAVTNAARQLAPIPERGDRWTHLSLCVLDAVFSIGARYSTTCRTVWSYAAHAELDPVLAPAAAVSSGTFASTEEPITGLRTRIEALGPEAFARDVLRNRQRTSPRGGVLKAEAAIGYARVLEGHGLLRLADVTELLEDNPRLTEVEAELARVPGHGVNGVRASYLWMLAGSDDLIKPDRMVLGWLVRVLGRHLTAAEARSLLAGAAEVLGVTAWQLDHAIWNAQRTTYMTRPVPR